ncbi:hypothetical protein ASG92_21605 [Arthrobacter sp. Soil736]|uniref:Wadjet anti-phage system protein JetD domain-containing protein n=1 Tax=Arthrobacter sp. Soil736 TaxID=1736395 RepID=UPI000713857F|nr:Wadjet anti-phage system protein JetD domain-containing protein [Arthrobacter sp. Soil736]KRE60548.1 hypothetical protein ASG92_21605 [Arthrobacter sp. Soil736]
MGGHGIPEQLQGRTALTGGEQRALKRLRDEGDVRLEQERIPWQTALKSLQTAWEKIAERSQ